MTKSILIALTAVAMVSIPATCASTTAAKAAKAAQHSPWRPETLSGKITMVDPALHLVVVRDSSGVPFDMVVNRSTHIKSANRALQLKDLNSDLNRNASIKFVPETRGDVAETIDVQQ
jgi:hypothetical protein